MISSKIFAVCFVFVFVSFVAYMVFGLSDDEMMTKTEISKNQLNRISVSVIIGIIAGSAIGLFS